jgi:hypothetical protein
MLRGMTIFDSGWYPVGVAAPRDLLMVYAKVRRDDLSPEAKRTVQAWLVSRRQDRRGSPGVLKQGHTIDRKE